LLVIGLSHEHLSSVEVRAAVKRYKDRFHVPVVDPLVDDVGEMVEMFESLVEKVA
jgi:uncharacterized NAD-dependent epimerase/dehydratase family protein